MTGRITYDFNGVKHIQQGNNFRAVTGEEAMVFERLQDLESQGNWAAVREICEMQIAKTPEWLTPYLCAGVASANLGQESEAIERLEHVQRLCGDDPNYAAAARILTQLKKQI
jgi:hypothetical protein